MKKKVFSLMMMLLLAVTGIVRAQELTVHDGTTTNSYVPFYGLWVDDYTRSEMIYPADELSSMAGGNINSMSFYKSSSNTNSWGSASFQVYLKEVTNTTLSAYLGMTDATIVYSGSIDAAGGERQVTINFSTPYHYNGGNLLVGIYETETGTYSSAYWYGTSASGASASGYNSSNPANATFNQRNFLPKTTFTYSGGGGSFTDKLHVKYMDGEEEVIDSLNLGLRPVGAWMEPFQITMYSDGPAYTVNVLDFTPNDGMFSVEGIEVPFQVSGTNDVDMNIATGAQALAGVIERQFVAITEGRAAHVWPIVVEMYDPAIPDVVETAYDFGTIDAGFSYEGIPSQITPTELHDNYTLPFPEIEEGVDAVYKFTVNGDMVINAYVDENAENGKVALYTEDFNGEPGPMATNNYTGLAAPGTGGGSAGSTPFEIQIGDGTSTTGYLPMYYLYNYSLSTQLYLATELAAAGATSAPMSSIAWFSNSTYAYNIQNISIWMANVPDTEVSTTSPLGSGMNLVYQGNFQEVVGWNEFVFNAGSFAWDGHSNVLVMTQMNNGEWSSSIQWQCGNVGFNAGSYVYQDNTPYSAGNTTYTMSTTTSRANTQFKSTGRNRDQVLFSDTFEAGNLDNWTVIDNGSPAGYGWEYLNTTTLGWDQGEAGHSGIGVACSWSWNGSAINQNSYMISPMVEGATSIKYYVCTNTGYPDHYQIMASSTGTNTSDFTVVFEEDAYRGSAMGNGIKSSSTQAGNRDISAWAEKNITLPAGTKYVAFHHVDYDENYLFVDDVTIYGSNTPTPPGPNPPTPTPGYTSLASAGPVIENLPITAGTYYLVASATQADYTVYINVDNMPCPAIEAEGFAFNPMPADNEDEVEPASVTLQWLVPEYATGWRLIFGSTYHPEPGHPQTIIYPEDGSFTTNMANSFTVRNLWNNNNYFWRVEFNNGGCPEGVSSPVFGFTTHLNVPQNLSVVDETIFDDEQVVLNWNAVVDRTYRMYNVYRDGVCIGHTTVNNIGNTTYTDGPLAYNMEGYVYYVTAVYDEGESAPSNTVTVKVSGYGDVNGHVYEQDGQVGIAGATVTMVGQDEYGVNHTYNFTTNGQGYYSGHIYVGSYNGQAAKDGYQTITEPVQGNPIAINYNETNSPVDYILDENFDPVCTVIAEYYPDSLDPNSPYVKVYWGCGLPGEEIIEPFETGDFSLFDWQVDPTYPWTVTTTSPYEGTYCMKSGGAGVANVVSNMTVTVNIPDDGIMSFWGKISCESSWDYGYFYIDGVQKGSYTGQGSWAEKTFDITAGDHTFQWRYTKDGSVNSYDDCFYVDYITFYRRPEPAMPGMTYDFEDSTMQGWTSVDADGDGYGWYVASEIMSTGYGHNSSNDCVLSQSYDNSVGVLYPDNYLVSPMVQLGGAIRFYACAQDASYAAEHFGVAVSTTNTNPSSFTMLNEWTMSAKSVGEPVGKPVKGSRSGRAQGNWYEFTVDLSAYSGNGYVAIRHFNCSDMFYLDVDDITIGEPGKSLPTTDDRSLSHYKIYRTDCYNDGPYTEENTILLATNWPGDTIYIDVEWSDLPAGVYKWGVSCVYVGNRGQEIEGQINWSEPANVNRATLTYDFDDSSLQGWTTIDGGSPAGYGWQLGSTKLGTGYGHNGSADMVLSQSYDNSYGVVYPDNYLISPQVELGGSISFWACGQDANYAAEHFGVAVSTTTNTSASAFTMLQEWTIGSKSVSGAKETVRGNRDQSTWTQYTVDLSAYSGMGYVAIRHFNCSDMFYLDVDDITIVEGAGGPTPPTPPTPGSNGLQEPRESEIVWSNCLDKDMWLDHVSVNVLLNSADSPEGTTVTFTNLNEYEQENYPIAGITLDQTGYYEWDQFRRGDYVVHVDHIGYVPIVDTVSIWQNTDLRYVMIEIIYGVENVYVSRTGWAMWDPLDPQQGGSGVIPGGGGGGGGQGGGNGDTFSVDFEAGIPAGWTTIDGGTPSGYGWQLASTKIGTGYGHNGSSDCVLSQSYDNSYGVVYPDNYLVSPAVVLANGSTFSFWACAQDASYAAEHFGVFVSDNGTSNWTMVNEWTIGAKSVNGAKETIRGNRDQSTWTQYTVDLSAFAGTKYIAIRHFNCSDQFYLDVDDIALTNGAKNGGDRHFEYYKVMCTSIDGEPIFNHNTVHPFCQLTTVDPNSGLPVLYEGDHYLCKIAVMYSTGMSEWSEPVEWVYEPCDHWGPVDEVTVNATTQGNHIEWVFDHGYNPYGGDTPGPGPQPGVGDWYYYDNGVNEDAIGTGGGNFWWGVMFPAGSYTGNMVTKVSAYDYMAMSGNVTIYVGGSNAPGTSVGQTNVTFTGSEQFVEFEFAEPVTIDPTQNVWVVFYNGSGATYPAAVCANTGDANGRWVSLDGAAWDDLAGYGLDYTFMVRAYIAQGAKGEVKEFKVNTPVAHNNGTFAISGNGPRALSGLTFNKGGEFYTQYAEDGVMLNFLALDNVYLRAYMLFKLSNDSRFSLVPDTEYGQFILTSNVTNLNFMNEVESVYSNALADFNLLSKADIDNNMTNWKSGVSPTNYNSIMMDVLMSNNRPDNDHCINSLPFCTSEVITFQAANTSNTANEPGMDDGCIGSSYNPSFYHMRIHTAGPFVIHMEGHDPDNGTTRDIDFCMWGPYTEQEITSGTACQNLTGDKIMDCCYSSSYTEDCFLGYTESQHQHNTTHGTINYHMPEVGEYYILMITNFSQQPCVINFTKTEGEGETDCEIVTPSNVIGFLITEDGEYVAFAGPDDREYTVEGEYGDHEYCVRPIYPGQMILPDHNYGWSMGCPVCEFGPNGQGCAPGAPIHAENMEGGDQIKVWWGDQNPGPGPGGCEGDEFTVDFESGIPTGWTTIDADGDGYNWMLASVGMGTGYGHNGSSDMILSQSYNNNVGALTPDNWLVSPEVTLCEGSVFSFWACAQDAAWASEHFGVAVSDDNNQFVMVQEWTLTAKGQRYDGPRGMRDQGNWYQYTVDLGDYAGEGRYVAIRHFNCTDWFYIDVDDIQLTAGAKGNRAGIENYNVYRSTEANGDYALIGVVPAVVGQTYYEYIDTPETAGTYYYQVRADYGDCLSDPAQAADDPTHNYVSGTTDGIGENSDNVALYPNPTTGNVTIQANSMNRITVVSMLGQVVYDTELNADTYTLNMGQFNAGMYMVRVYTESGMTVKRVTVMQ